MNELMLKKYAELLVLAGGNVQEGQLVVIGCDVRDAYFGRLVLECAYNAGASEVIIDWSDEFSTRTTYLKAAGDIFDKFPQWKADKLHYQDDLGAVYLNTYSPNPDLLQGVDSDRLKRFSIARSTATKKHASLLMSGALRWSVAAIPNPNWAMKVFPHLSENEAMIRLWEHVLKAARADGEKPIENWKIHNKTFAKRVDYLNKQQFSALRISSSLGTDLTIGLVNNHRWAGGGEIAKDGVPFFPNIPTEEIFTMPDRNKAEGRVVASMPLSYQGNLIEGIEMTFKDGQVVDYHADKNKNFLANIIEIDEGSRRLGEVALVANSSPISQMNTLFYDTLFDENASSHLALGKAYPHNIRGGSELSTDELIALGGNDSLIHVDFMFGTQDMNVTGIKQDGKEVLFFENGEFKN